jgi:hypothetical protein
MRDLTHAFLSPVTLSFSLTRVCAQVLKIINSDRPEKMVKELWKYLEGTKGAGGGKKGGGKRK